MKKLFITSWLLLVFVATQAQFRSLHQLIDRVPEAQFRAATLFTSKPPSAESAYLYTYVSRFDLLEVNAEALRSLAAQDAPLRLALPLDGQWVNLRLVRNQGLNDLLVTTQEIGRDQIPYPYRRGAYYQGVIEGQAGSWAAISFFDNDIMGLVVNSAGTYVIGQSNLHRTIADEYIVYNEKNMLVKDIQPCAFNEALQIAQAAPETYQVEAYTIKCVKFYWELDYDKYLDHGSNVTATTNFATGLYNLVSTLYLNDSVLTGLQQVNVWTSTDPYAAAATTSAMLTAFSSQMSTNGFNGDLAHLLSGRSAGGGIAWLNTLCSSNYYRTAVSAGLGTSLTPLPTYSWNTEVVTHELGHNMGSPHTHACAWNGNSTRIDNCAGNYNVQYQEGNCNSFPPNPAGGGTIMSYCHLQAVGINLSLGFGPQPGALIRNKVNIAPCLGICTACESSVVITGMVSDPLIESAGSISSSGQTTIDPVASVKLDADPSGGFVLMAPAGNNDFFAAIPGNTAAMFVAQAFNGCNSGEPSKPGLQQNAAADDEDVQGLRVYPNPSNGMLYVESSSFLNEHVQWQIFGPDGRLLRKGLTGTAAGRFMLDVSTLPPGLYLLRTESGEGIRFVRGRD